MNYITLTSEQSDALEALLESTIISVHNDMLLDKDPMIKLYLGILEDILSEVRHDQY